MNEYNVKAQSPLEYIPHSGDYATDYTTPGNFIGTIVNIFLGIAISVSILGIMFSGIKIAASKGDPRAMDEARSYLGHSVTALVISLVAITIEYLIRTSLGASGTNMGIGL